jgi:hypothetical protein
MSGAASALRTMRCFTKAARWGLASLLVGALAAGCSGQDDPGERTLGFRAGDRESDLLRAAGPPTRVDRNESSNDPSWCGSSRSRAKRALVYDLPTQGLGAFVRRHVKRVPPSTTIILCIDDSGTIVDTSFVAY